MTRLAPSGGGGGGGGGGAEEESGGVGVGASSASSVQRQPKMTPLRTAIMEDNSRWEENRLLTR